MFGDGFRRAGMGPSGSLSTPHCERSVGMPLELMCRKNLGSDLGATLPVGQPTET